MRFTRRRRGISYILEVVMMTLVIVALASAVLTWGIGTISDSRLALTNAVNGRMDRLQEGVVIEDVQMLTSTTMRMYVRNTGSIQVVVDAGYANNVNTPVQGVCPVGSFQGGVATITAPLTSSLPVTLSLAEPNTGYTVKLTTSWAGSPTASVASGTTTTSFTISLTSSLSSGSVNWSTNYGTCPSGTRLSLSVGALGAIDVSVPTSVSSCSGGPVCAGSSYSVTVSTTRGTTFTGTFTV